MILLHYVGSRPYTEWRMSWLLQGVCIGQPVSRECCHFAHVCRMREQLVPEPAQCIFSLTVYYRMLWLRDFTWIQIHEAFGELWILESRFSTITECNFVRNVWQNYELFDTVWNNHPLLKHTFDDILLILWVWHSISKVLFCRKFCYEPLPMQRNQSGCQFSLAVLSMWMSSINTQTL